MKLILNALIIFAISSLLHGCGGGGGGGGSSSSSSSSTSTTSSSGSSTSVTETTTVTETVSESEYIDSEYTTCEDDCSESESDYVCEDDCSDYDYVDTYIDTTTTYTDTYVDTTYTDTYVDSGNTSTYVGGGSSSYTPVYIPPPKTTKPVAPAPIPSYEGVSLTVSLPMKTRGLWWDESSNVLYMGGGRVLFTWSQTQGFLSQTILLGPSEATNATVTHVFKVDDKQFLVSFYQNDLLSAQYNSHTMDGFLSQVSNGYSEVIQGVSSTLWRFGITRDDHGQLYECGFIPTPDNKGASFVYRLSLIEGSSPVMAQETEAIYGADRSISGCIISGGNLYFSELQTNQIYSVPVSQLVVRQDINQLKVHAQIPNPHHIVVAAEDGTLFVSGSTLPTESTPYVIYKVSPQGVVTHFKTIKANNLIIRIDGMAYDAVNKRLFITIHEHDEHDWKLEYDKNRLLVFNLK